MVDDASVELVGASSGIQQALASQEGEAVADDEPAALEADAPALALPGSVAYAGTDYAFTSIAPYAFYLSGVTSVVLPASVTDVDERAFRSSDVSSVDVAEGSGSFASFDGALYDADLTRLLLIPGGRTGAVRVPDTATSVPASAFSHCAGVGSIAVDEGSPAFSSWEGSLYDADGTTLLRVPAGATDITIRDGCTTIAAGAMEGCASLATITAPASVASISPYLFEQQPEAVMAPVALAAVEDDAEGEGDLADGGEPDEADPADAQLTALVALTSTDDDLPEVDCSRVMVQLMAKDDADEWKRLGFVVTVGEAAQLLDEGNSSDAPTVESSLQSAETYGANTFTIRNCMELESSDLFYYITIGAISTSANTVTLGGSAGSNHFNNMLFGTDVNSQWSMYNTPYGMAVVRSDGKGFLLSKSPFSSSYPTSFTSASTYLSYYTPWECAYYVKKDGTVVKQPGNYQTFYWNQVSEVYMTPGPSILETYHYNDGTGRTYQCWMAPSYSWKNVFSISRTGYTSQGWWTSATGGSKFADMGGSTTTVYKSVTARTTRNYYAHWAANSYTVEYWNKAGTARLSSDANFKYDTSRTLAVKPSSGITNGYTAVGWATSTNQSSATYGFGTSQKNLATSGTKKLYLAETANTITLTWNSQGGSAVASTSKIYSSSAKVPMPASNPTRAGYTFAGWWTAASGGTQVTSSTALPTANTTYHAHWSLNPYSIAYELDGGSVSGNPTTYDVTTTTFTLKNPVRTGYAFAGWSGTGLSGSANKTVTIAKGSTGNRSYTAHWSANPYTVEYWDKAGATKLSSDAGFRYDTARALAAKPSSGVSAGYTATGWARSAGQSSAAYGFGSSQANLATSGTVALYLAERPNAYTVAFEPNGGAGGPFADIAATYDAYLELPATARQGYVFLGWKDEATGATFQPGQVRNLASDDGAIVRLSAQWMPVVSADIPLEVTAQVDLLGIEEQQEAAGYIESRCGEPLTVAAIELSPLSGASELFGAANVADVALEVRTDATASPDATFALDASASKAPATPAAFRMASYGTRVPISYRFDIPEALLPTLVETTKPVCSVAYTVALASVTS